MKRKPHSLTLPSGPATVVALDEIGKALLAQAGHDQDARLVLEDYCKENDIRGGSARLRWLDTGPTLFQIDRTLFVVGHETTADSYRENEDGARLGFGYAYWLRGARPWLDLHPTAKWVRCIRAEGQYKPAEGEILLVRRRYLSHFGEQGALEARCGLDACRCPVGEATLTEEAERRSKVDRAFYETFTPLTRTFTRRRSGERT